MAQSWRQIEDFYELGSVIGGGHNDTLVRSAIHRITGQRCAVKVIDKSVMKLLDLWRFVEMEIQVLQMVYHPNIVHLLEVYVSPRVVYIVTERAVGGDLFSYTRSTMPCG